MRVSCLHLYSNAGTTGYDRFSSDNCEWYLVRYDNLKQFQFDVLVKTVFLSFITESTGKIY